MAIDLETYVSPSFKFNISLDILITSPFICLFTYIFNINHCNISAKVDENAANIVNMTWTGIQAGMRVSLSNTKRLKRLKTGLGLKRAKVNKNKGDEKLRKVI